MNEDDNTPMDGDITPMLAELNPHEAALLDLIVVKPEREKIVKKTFIFLLGSFPSLQGQESVGSGKPIKITPYLPRYPSKAAVIKSYVKPLTPIKLLQREYGKTAIDSGVINSEQEKIYMNELDDKVSAIFEKLSEAGIIDINKVSQTARTIQHSDGTAFRKLSG